MPVNDTRRCVTLSNLKSYLVTIGIFPRKQYSNLTCPGFPAVGGRGSSFRAPWTTTNRGWRAAAAGRTDVGRDCRFQAVFKRTASGDRRPKELAALRPLLEELSQDSGGR
jgi:hypothetical protein